MNDSSDYIEPLEGEPVPPRRVRQRARVNQDWDSIRGWGYRGVPLELVADATRRLWEDRVWERRGFVSWDAMFADRIGEPLQLSRRNRNRLKELLGDLPPEVVAVVIGPDRPPKPRPIKVVEAEVVVVEPEPVVVEPDAAASKRTNNLAASAAITQQIVEMVADGKSYPEIAAVVGITRDAVRLRYNKHLRKQEGYVPPPPRPKPVPKPKPELSPELVALSSPERIAVLAKTGITSLQIARELGITQERVRWLARRDSISLVGDINRGKGGVRVIDTPAAVNNWLTHMRAALDSADAFIDIDDIGVTDAAELASQLNDINNRIRVLTRKFQKHANPERGTQ